MGILEILTVVFVIAKLVGLIAWSWGQVFIPLIIAGIITIFYILVYLLANGGIRRR